MSCTTRKSSCSSSSLNVALVDPGVGGVGGDDPQALDLPVSDAFDDLVVGQLRLRRECARRRCRGSRRPSRDAPALAKSWPPSRLVVLLNSREPIALHWPVIEFAPVPGRPMLPVISARLMIACAVRDASWLWLTPIVHQNETRLPSCDRLRKLLELLRARARSLGTRASGVKSRDVLRELLEAGGVRVDELAIDPAAAR